MTKTKFAAIVSLTVMVIVLIAAFIASCNDGVETEIVDLAWDAPSVNDLDSQIKGYRVYVTTYYDRYDRSLSVEQVYNVPVSQTTISVEVRKTSDMIDTAVKNVCFQVSTFSDDQESGRSAEECMRPWPPQGIKVK